MSRELPGSEGGGLATYTFTMCRALAARGHEVHVLACAPGRDVRTRAIDGFTVHERSIVAWPWIGRLTRLSATSRNLRTAVAVRRGVAALDLAFDVIQVADFGAEGFLLNRRAASLVVRISGPSGLLGAGRGLRARADLRLTSWMERRVTRRADLVVTPSSRTGELLRSMGWLREPAALVRSPVDVSRWEVPRSPSDTGPTVAAIGRVEHLKGIDRLLDAAALLADVPGLRVVVAGRSNGRRDGVDYAEWAARRAEELGVTLELTGPVPPSELPALLGDVRVVAMLSRFDNFPNSALEAMAAGRPVVCTPGTGIDELLAGSDAGSIVAPDATSIARALRAYLVDPHAADRAGAAGRRLVTAACDPDVVAEQWEQAVGARRRDHRG